jgi:hypothetical protein
VFESRKGEADTPHTTPRDKPSLPALSWWGEGRDSDRGGPDRTGPDRLPARPPEMDPFVERALEKLRRDASARKLKHIRDAIDKCKFQAGTVPANASWEPLRLACEAGSQFPKVAACALDITAKLCAHAHLVDHYLGPVDPSLFKKWPASAAQAEGGGQEDPVYPKTFSDEMLETLCAVNTSDEGTELQLIKCLLTAITCQVSARGSLRFPRDVD